MFVATEYRELEPNTLSTGPCKVFLWMWFTAHTAARALIKYETASLPSTVAHKVANPFVLDAFVLDVFHYRGYQYPVINNFFSFMC